MSVQTVTQSINALAAGLNQVKEETSQLKQIHSLSANDKFVHVMQVGRPFLNMETVDMVMLQTFVDEVSPSVEALKNMSVAVEEELRSLLLYFGEQPESPDTCKPEDFFALIQSFSSSLQVSKW